MSDLGRRIRELRLEAGLSQRALAERVGVGFPHLSKIEAGKETASSDLLMRIAEAVGVEPDELILLAGRIPDDVSGVLLEKPDLASLFFRKWRKGEISDDEVRGLLSQGQEDE